MATQQATSSPSGDLVAVTPHDTNALASGVTRGLYVGGSGNIAVTTQNGQSVTLVGVAAGIILPVRVTHVKATNTTATSIVAVY